MAFDNIHNYYETMVITKINDMREAEFINSDQDFLEDVACVSLNQLPCRYVRHDVDLVYYLTGDERDKMEYEVHRAVTAAIEYVSSHRTTRTQSA